MTRPSYANPPPESSKLSLEFGQYEGHGVLKSYGAITGKTEFAGRGLWFTQNTAWSTPHG